jgi:hypothetical protein
MRKQQFQIQIDFAGLHVRRAYNPAKLGSAKVRLRRTFAEPSFEFGIADAKGLSAEG